MKIRKNTTAASGAAWIKWFIPLISGLVGSIVIAWCYGVWVVLNDEPGSSSAQHQRAARTTSGGAISDTQQKEHNQQQQQRQPFCSFRRYPPHRYYDLKESLDFLINDEYIYGEWPIQLNENGHPKTKFCVDQSEWLPATTNPRIWPFADGTNPSILSLQRIRDRGATDFADQVHQLFGSTAAWVTTICMTNSQCTWNDTEEMRAQSYDLPNLEKTTPNTVRTLLQVYTEDFSLLGEQTIFLLRDAPWGRKHTKVDQSWQIPALDDARLFLHDSRVYVSFREGPGFGFENQVLHPLHFKQDRRTYIQASESSSMCCGRNMALIDDGANGMLQALTWVDPVTIEEVDATPGRHAKPQRKTKEERQMARQIKKSHIHGTNGYMIPVSDTELLGVAHFHRPNDRKPNPHARFGHHYTHAFYLVSRTEQRLTALSPEFLLAGTEIIQFISGLEFDGTTVTLAYGINDCEGAVVQVDWATVVQPFLRKVSAGQQVVDLMAPLKNGPSAAA